MSYLFFVPYKQEVNLAYIVFAVCYFFDSYIPSLLALKFQGTDNYSPYAAPPKPCYATDRCAMADSENLEAQRQPKDICYHILKLYSKRSHRLERVLCPNTHTEDPLDYQLW